MVADGDRASARAAAIRSLIAGAPGAPGHAGLLGRVCLVAARELAALGAAVTVLTGDGLRGLSAASDPVIERLEELQFTLGEGPCIDAIESRRPVLIADLSGPAMSRWPAYAPAVREGGVGAVFAFPLQVGAARLGMLDVFRRQPGPLSEAELEIALHLADATVEGLLDRQEEEGRRGDTDGLAWDVGNRAQLYQAQGMVMIQLGIALDEALVRMRAYAFAEDRRLDDVARDIVNRTLRFDLDTP